MKYGMRAVGRAEQLAGFAAAGLPITVVDPDAVGSLVIHDLLDEPDIGVVLMSRDVYDSVAPILERQLARKSLPMVVPIPNPEWSERAGSAEHHIVELLRRAIGYRVRVK